MPTYRPKQRDRRQQKRTKPQKGVVGTVEITALPENLREILEHLEINPRSDSYSMKPYNNKELKLPGRGPFREYVGKGNKGRIVHDTESGTFYVTQDHHNTYRTVE